MPVLSSVKNTPTNTRKFMSKVILANQFSVNALATLVPPLNKLKDNRKRSFSYHRAANSWSVKVQAGILGNHVACACSFLIAVKFKRIIVIGDSCQLAVVVTISSSLTFSARRSGRSCKQSLCSDGNNYMHQDELSWRNISEEATGQITRNHLPLLIPAVQ